MAEQNYEIEEMILNKVVRGIRDEFSKDEIKNVYKDKMPQDFTKPCAVVLEYDKKEYHLGNNRIQVFVWLDILFHIDFNTVQNTGIYTYMRKYAPRLSRAINYITLEPEYTHNSRVVKLRKKEWDVVIEDGVGHCMTRYDFYASIQDGSKKPPITSVTGEINVTQIP